MTSHLISIWQQKLLVCNKKLQKKCSRHTRLYHLIRKAWSMYTAVKSNQTVPTFIVVYFSSMKKSTVNSICSTIENKNRH